MGEGWKENCLGAMRKVCESREEGGLGIKDIRLFNVALLGKWIWHLLSEEGGLWKEILDSKYGGWRNLRSEENNPKESNWWKDLKKFGGRRNEGLTLRITSFGGLVTRSELSFGKISGLVVRL